MGEEFEVALSAVILLCMALVASTIAWIWTNNPATTIAVGMTFVLAGIGFVWFILEVWGVEE